LWDCGAQSGTFYRKIPHFLLGGIGKSHITKIHIRAVAAPPYPQRLWPHSSLSMATSAMDPNCGATAPYESNVGGRHQGSRLLRLIPLFGALKWHPSKICEMGGAPGLGGHHSTMTHNNQPNNGVGSGGGMGEETRPGGTCERGHLPVVSGGQMQRRKIKNRESNGTLSSDGFRWMGGRNNHRKSA